MKLTNVLIATVAAATISSCSLLDSILPKKSGISGASATPVEKTEKPVTEKTDKAAKVEKNNKVKTDEKMNERLNGEWIIVSASGKAIPVTDEMPYITFEKEGGKFYASNGCNVINGIYNVSPEGKVNFENVLSTMKMCPGTDY